MASPDENIPLETLVREFPLSVRAMGICMRNGLTTLYRLRFHFRTHGKFKNIQGCGDRVEYELTELLNRFNSTTPENQPKVIFKEHVEEVRVSPDRDLTPFKKATLTHHIQYLLSTLTVRALNGLKQQFGDSPWRTIMETLFEPDFDFLDIKNIGEKSAKELNGFRDKIATFVKTLALTEENDLSKQYTKLILRNAFTGLSENIDEILVATFDTNDKIKLFTLIHRLVSVGVIFKPAEKEIFQINYSFTKKNSKTYDTIAVDMNITKERVRQLKNTLQRQIGDYFEFITTLKVNDIASYDLDHSTPVIIIDHLKAKTINEKENVDFSYVFYSIIFGLLLRSSHAVLGDDEFIANEPYGKKPSKFKNCYLIDKTIFESFNFSSFVNDIYSKLSIKIEESYSIYFDGYLYSFLKQPNLKSITVLKNICEQIILHEFEVIVDGNGFLQFEKNTRQKTYEYALEVLESKSQMMTVYEISKAITERHPGLNIAPESIRASLQREKGIFIFFGRRSTYGLRKWETDQDNVKGGTIRDIIEEYLMTKDSPVHISEILVHVLKYRKTNERNVLTNIKMEENKRFVFFAAGFIGIKTKTYDFDTSDYKGGTGPRFTTRYMAKFNDWNLEDVVNHYHQEFGYNPIHVRHIIDKKITSGEIGICENKLVIK